MDLSDVLKVVGVVALTAAGLTVSPGVGLVVFGVLLIIGGIVMER